MSRWKQALGIAGILAAALGVAIGQRVLIWAAIALLGVSLVLRVVERIRTRRGVSAQDSLSDRTDE